MRILFFGDFSNFHASLAEELRRRGHDITVISDGGTYMKTANDIMLVRKPGISGTLSYLCRLATLFPKLRDYDVVQLINPHFLSLRPKRFRVFFDILKRQNRSVFLTFAGDDYAFMNACINSDMFRFSEFRIGNVPTEFDLLSNTSRLLTTSEEREAAMHIYDNVDGAMSVLPEYDMAARAVIDDDRLCFTNIPVDLSSIKYTPRSFDDKIRIFVGVKQGKEIQKGTRDLLRVARELQNELPGKVEAVCAENLPLHEYLEKMNESHIVLDQLYSYSPGMNAIQAMAMGLVTGSGAQPEYYRYLHETEGPIIPLSPLVSMDEWKSRIKELILSPERLKLMSGQGRTFVEKHNSVQRVADAFENHWSRILKQDL